MSAKPKPEPPKKRELRLLSFRARNMFGIEEFSIEPNGRGMLIKARNARDKSGILQSILATLGGGSLATYARVGRDGQPLGVPETMMVLDDTGGRMLLDKSGSETVKMRQQVGQTAAFEKVEQPQARLNAIFDRHAANPVALLQAKDEDLAILILESLPLDMDREAFDAILSEIADIFERPPVPTGLHPLEEIEMVRKAVFSTRTGVNTNLTGKKKAADQTLRNAPAVLPVDHSEQQAKLQRERDALAEQIAADRKGAAADEERAIDAANHTHQAHEAGIVSAFKAAKAKLQASHDVEAAEIRAEAEFRIAEKKASLDATIEDLRESDGAALEKGDTARDADILAAREARAAADEARREREDAFALLNSQLADLARDAKEAEKARNFHALAKQFEDEAEALEAEHGRLTAALNAIAAYRLELAKGLPVEGLEIVGKEVRVDGVVWSQVNQARRVEIAAKISLERRGPLGLVFLDGLESLDSENRNALLDYLIEHGAQPLGAQVTDGEQEIVYLGAVRAQAEALA